MERVVGADDDVAPRAGPSTSQLQGALVGLGARVGEEHLAAGLPRPAVDQPVDGQRHLGTQLVAVEVGDVAERARLGRHGLGHHGMGMAERDHGQARDEVQVALAVGVVELRALPRTNVAGGSA